MGAVYQSFQACQRVASCKPELLATEWVPCQKNHENEDSGTRIMQLKKTQAAKTFIPNFSPWMQASCSVDVN